MNLRRPTKRVARHFLRLVEDRINGYSEKRWEGCDLIAAKAPTNHSTQEDSREFRFHRKKIHRILKKMLCAAGKVRNACTFDPPHVHAVPASPSEQLPPQPERLLIRLF
jgi:hypothetical protein